MHNDKVCPQCGKQYPWYEAECTDCRVSLVALPKDSPSPDVDIVPVFEADEGGLLPLVKMTLDQAGIQYDTQHAPNGTRLGQYRTPTGDVVQVVVRAEDAQRARELLADLEAAGETTESPVVSKNARAAEGPVSADDAPVAIFDKESGMLLGRLTIDEFDSIAVHLEYESEDDDDYYIDEATLAMLEDQGADPRAVQMLRRALAGREGMDVRWVEE